MKSIRCFFIILLIPCFIVGCGSNKKLVSEIKITPELRAINQHYYSGDVSALLSDFAIYPKYRDYIYDLVFVDTDIKSFTTSQLKSFYNQTSDNSVKASLQLLIDDNEIKQLHSLEGSTPTQISQFCKSTTVSPKLLDDYINNCYIVNLDNLDYKEVKYLAKSFESTRFGTLLDNKCLSLKAANKKDIMKEVDEYLSKEDIIIKQCIKSMTQDVEKYLINQRFPIIADEIKDSRVPIFKKRIKSKMEKLVSENISVDYMDKICKKHIQNYTNDINNARNHIINSMGGEFTNTVSVTPRFYHDNIQMSEIDISALVGYNRSRNQAKAQVGLDLLEIVLGYMNEGVEYSPDPLDMLDYEDDSENLGKIQAKEGDVKDEFIKSLKSQLKAYCAKYVRDVAFYYSKSYESSKQQFRNAYYEQY